jgi:hypothetical protein
MSMTSTTITTTTITTQQQQHKSTVKKENILLSTTAYVDLNCSNYQFKDLQISLPSRDVNRSCLQDSVHDIGIGSGPQKKTRRFLKVD